MRDTAGPRGSNAGTYPSSVECSQSRDDLVKPWYVEKNSEKPTMSFTAGRRAPVPDIATTTFNH
jgi:hypothetical protein